MLKHNFLHKMLQISSDSPSFTALENLMDYCLPPSTSFFLPHRDVSVLSAHGEQWTMEIFCECSQVPGACISASPSIVPWEKQAGRDGPRAPAVTCPQHHADSQRWTHTWGGGAQWGAALLGSLETSDKRWCHIPSWTHSRLPSPFEIAYHSLLFQMWFHIDDFTIDSFVWFLGWESLGLQGDPTSPFWRRSVLGFLWKEWC